jgi:hypothetical protein
MKRYRIVSEDFDSRASILKLEIKDDWDPAVKKMWQENQKNIRAALQFDYGVTNFDAKLKNFLDLDAAPFSVLAFHNTFFHQVRRSFIIGAYYPALTGACALGERILNHVLIRLRDFFKGTEQYKKVYNKNSFDNWDVPINTLAAWKVLRPETVELFKKLKESRNKGIHFNPETDHNDRALALDAIKTLSAIIEVQFGAFGAHPWFIEGIAGAAYIKKSFESEPFIRQIYIPNCFFVGPKHRLQFQNNKWSVIDSFEYGSKEVSDEEFTKLLAQGQK